MFITIMAILGGFIINNGQSLIMQNQHHSQNYTVSNYFARTHLANTVRIGGDEKEILSLAGLTNEIIKAPRARIAPQQLSTIVKANWRVGNDEFMGLASQRVKVGVFQLLAERLVDCSTLGDALNEAAYFYNLITDSIQFELNMTSSQVSFGFSLPGANKENTSFLVEFLLLIWHRFPSWLVGKVIPLQEVQFDYKEPLHSDEYRLMFPSVCRYQCEGSALVFDRAVMELPIIQTLVELKHYLSEIPLPWFRKPDFHDSFTAQVNRFFEEGFFQEETSLDIIAKKMHTTSRTLRRKLTAEGSSFQQLKDNSRRDSAINLLADNRVSISEVGRRIGFTETPAFTRAFKQWTGLSPGAYRKGLHKQHLDG